MIAQLEAIEFQLDVIVIIMAMGFIVLMIHLWRHWNDRGGKR